MGFELHINADFFDSRESMKIREEYGPNADIYPLRVLAWCCRYRKSKLSDSDIRFASQWTGKIQHIKSILICFGLIEPDGTICKPFCKQIKKSIRHDYRERRTMRAILHPNRRPDLNSYAWRKLRKDVLSEQGTNCFYCGIDCSSRPTIDHIDPVSKGADPFDKSKLVVACRSCNSKKGAK